MEEENKKESPISTILWVGFVGLIILYSWGFFSVEANPEETIVAVSYIKELNESPLTRDCNVFYSQVNKFTEKWNSNSIGSITNYRAWMPTEWEAYDNLVGSAWRCVESLKWHANIKDYQQLKNTTNFNSDTIRTNRGFGTNAKPV